MDRIVECIPNFSEGKNQEVIDRIVGEIKKVRGVKLLDVESDADHNRSVVTFLGEPEAVAESVFLATKKASELIDLNKHKGEHPRIGATDVIPFVPISNVTMEECVELAKKVGERIASELKIPVYLYEAAATRPECINLADIRKGEYEDLRKDIETDPHRKPDFGPSKLHPTAGATVVGAREPLIAFNVNLGTDDIEIAKKIAKTVRFSSGGLKCVKAKGFEIKKRGIVQVSMNLTNYRETPISKAFEMVKCEADRYGVPITGSEIIGLVPLDAMVDVADVYLKLENFKKGQILETRLWE
ncbi:MAG: glutamate formimidoyltransferase [Candidatus Micrarchaeota archaeon]|nr:glutamate formimidoyltransferase [Candidatus Micrarchaeota archaeon]